MLNFPCGKVPCFFEFFAGAVFTRGDAPMKCSNRIEREEEARYAEAAEHTVRTIGFHELALKLSFPKRRNEIPNESPPCAQLPDPFCSTLLQQFLIAGSRLIALETEQDKPGLQTERSDPYTTCLSIFLVPPLPCPAALTDQPSSEVHHDTENIFASCDGWATPRPRSRHFILHDRSHFSTQSGSGVL